MKVPFIDFKREWKFFETKFFKVFQSVGKSGVYVLGSEVEKFERAFARFCGYKYAATVSTGLSALEISLRAHGIKASDEVITVANTAVATALAISNVGAKPVFCDVGEDFLIDPAKIEALITRRTKAILPVHLFGKICDMTAINKIAKKHSLIILEDACQAHGAKYAGQSLKNTKAFSFYPTKNLGAMGEGGMVVTNDEKIYKFVVSYRNYGQAGRYNHVIKGSNSRLDPFKCALLNEKLKSMRRAVNIRRKLALNYIKALSVMNGLAVNSYDATSSYHLFVTRVLNGQRDQLRSYLKQNGIETLVHYPVSIYEQPCYRSEYPQLRLVNTDKFQQEILSLPCYPFLTIGEQKFVIQKIKEFFK